MSEQNRNNSYHSRGNGSVNKNGYYGGEYISAEPMHSDERNSDEIDLKHLINVTLRYKWWVVGITLAFTAVAFLYSQTLDNLYTSSGTMVIAEERNRYSWAGSDISSIMSSSFGVGVGSRLVNEVQVLQSRQLAEEIAMKMHEQEVMENGERFPLLYYSYPDDSTKVSVDALASRIRNRLNVDQVDRDTDVLRISFTTLHPLESKYLVNTTIDTYTEVSARQRRSAANSALAFLEQERADAESRLTNSEEALRDYMSRTNLVQIDGQTTTVINRLAELESQRQQVQVQRVGINSSIEAYEGQLEQIRPGLAEQFADNISATMERSQFRLAELETERTLLLQRNPSLRNNPELEPQFVNLEDEIQQLKNQINRMAADLLGDESDIFVGFLNSSEGGLTGRIMELRQRLIQLRIEESQLNAQEEVLTQRVEEENEFFDGLPENMIEYARLQRETMVNEQLYSTISEQFTQTTLWEQTQFGAGRPLDYGLAPMSPSGPNRALYTLIGLMLGGVFSIGFVFTRENLNRTIDGTEKLKRTGYPLLATIPDMNPLLKKRYNNEQFINVEDHRVSTAWAALLDTISPVAESFRRLHNNIIYSDPDIDNKVVLITSSKKGEGKTTVSMNLAVTFAESGKKVLVIDTDLRRPTVHRFSGVARVPGVAEIFYDDKSYSSAIKPTIAPGVHVLTAGRKIPNPSAVIQSKKLRALLERVKEKYDHIIIDTPPFGVITDAAPVIKLADMVVLVTRFGVTQTNELNFTIENLKRIQANLTGTVITAFNHRESADYYYSNKYTYDSYQAYEAYQEEEENSVL
ncbi:MAG: polysaccharide biosynthesis tyrosine autokinase [Balneolaceae bacterium]|nr:polysaccharide biosynthesis tyrosine autokinase [Balneolaceae bacterium]